MASNAYILYHTDGCHLCDLAMDLLEQVKVEQSSLEYRLVDICDDEALAEAYGTRIPVVKQQETAKELGWPFTAEQLIAFIGD